VEPGPLSNPNQDSRIEAEIKARLVAQKLAKLACLGASAAPASSA
jgi:hypothetical protein